MSYAQLGKVAEDSFIPQLLRNGNKGLPIDQLGEEKHTLLGGWIKALFGDGEGISDELYSSCRPQDFFLLVPTLFAQSVEACNRGMVDMVTMKGGLECKSILFLIQVGNTSMINEIYRYAFAFSYCFAS